MLTTIIEAIVALTAIIFLFVYHKVLFFTIFALFLWLSMILNVYFICISWSFAKSETHHTTKVIILNINGKDVNNSSSEFNHHQSKTSNYRRTYIVPNNEVDLNLNYGLQTKGINEENKCIQLKNRHNQINPKKKTSKNTEFNELFDLRSKSPKNSHPISNQYIFNEGQAIIDF